MTPSDVSDAPLGPGVLVEPPRLRVFGAGDAKERIWVRSDLHGRGHDQQQGSTSSLLGGVQLSCVTSYIHGMEQCGFCGVLQASWEAFGRHLREVHREEDLCPLCLDKTTRLSSRHTAKHRAGTPWRCDLCTAVFLHQHQLRSHKKTYHRMPPWAIW
ncbi:hypothetical protein ONE63_008182 [Megalurothrips usitatus]|uniref:C2H2-type domain-containing protein n=1 Tax=Megalurothrips usitatus TaxID=439358 RepID=A0AAV7XLQ5_9NEOP|nr:hypothetical protein ONE63_008182 [Megalurothrips usitatus]